MMLDWHQNNNNFKKVLDSLKDQLFKDALIPAKAFENIENRTSEEKIFSVLKQMEQMIKQIQHPLNNICVAFSPFWCILSVWQPDTPI